MLQSLESTTSPTYNWTNVKRRLSIFYRKKYQELGDLSYINEFTKNGLNIDLNQQLFDEPDQDFFRRWKVTAIVDTVTLWVIITSSIFWDSNQVDPLYAGNYLIGFGIPKEITVIAFTSAVVSTSATLFFSYKIFIKDPYLFYMMKLLRLVSGITNNYGRGVPPEVIGKLRSEIKPLIAFFRILIRGFHSGRCVGFIMAFGAYAWISVDNITNPWRLVLTIIWCIHFSIFVDKLLWSNFACFLVTFVVSRFVVLTTKILEEEESALKIEAASEDLFFHQLNQMMSTLYFIRRYNINMRSVIGFTTTFLVAELTAFFFALFFAHDLPMQIFYIFSFFLPVYLSIFIMALSLIAKFSFAFREKTKRVFRMADDINIEPRVRQRLNYIMDEMRHETSFDWFTFYHEIDYAFILKVLAEMLCFLILAVDVYVVG